MNAEFANLKKNLIFFIFAKIGNKQQLLLTWASRAESMAEYNFKNALTYWVHINYTVYMLAMMLRK